MMTENATNAQRVALKLLERDEPLSDEDLSKYAIPRRDMDILLHAKVVHLLVLYTRGELPKVTYRITDYGIHYWRMIQEEDKEQESADGPF